MAPLYRIHRDWDARWGFITVITRNGAIVERTECQDAATGLAAAIASARRDIKLARTLGI